MSVEELIEILQRMPPRAIVRTLVRQQDEDCIYDGVECEINDHWKYDSGDNEVTMFGRLTGE